MDLASEAVLAAAWPLALTMACAVAVERRRASQRRAALNRALHELRRPLQLLALARGGQPASNDSSPGAVETALAALGDLDAEINGQPAAELRRAVAARGLLASAAERWRAPVALLGRELELELPAGEPVLQADPAALSRAIDNLIANSLEHGSSRVRIAARVRGPRLRIAVADGGAEAARGSVAGPIARRPCGTGDPRRGHGLAVVTRIAAAHGGRFALLRGDSGSIAVLELPLVRPSEPPAG